MPPARKHRRRRPTTVPELPVCLLLDITARTGDAATIFRCAATCKLLRREIQTTGFLRRVCHDAGPDAAAVVPSKTLAILGETFAVLHPVTAATANLETRLAPLMSGLLQQYAPLTSRHGLVVLCRRSLGCDRRRRSAADLCVFDPMAANHRVFLPSAPDIDPGLFGGEVHLVDRCALLTAADGIAGCSSSSFMLLAVDIARNDDLDDDESSARVRVQTAVSSTSDAGGAAGWGWGPVKRFERHPCPRWCANADTHSDGAVVVAGAGGGGGVVVHWLMHAGISSSPSLSLAGDDDDGDDDVFGEYILTYDVGTAAVGSVEVPTEGRRRPNLRREAAPPCGLAASPDGKRLSFVVADHGAVSVWVLSSSSSSSSSSGGGGAGGGGSTWARQVKVGTMAAAERGPRLNPWAFTGSRVELDESGGAVVLRCGGVRFALVDMETTAACRACLLGGTGVLYDVDVASRLASMKSF